MPAVAISEPALLHLAGDQLGEGARDDPHRLRAEVGHEPGGVGEQVVAGEDRDGVVPAGVRGGGPAAHGGLVHHVVVVERGQVHQLDDGGRPYHLVVVAVAELRGEQGEQRPEPLTTGVDEVQRRLGDEVQLAAQLLVQQPLDAFQADLDSGGQVGVGQVETQPTA